MSMVQLRKPQPSTRPTVEVYHSESIFVDSTTSVMEACAGCHNLSKTHQDKANLSIGVGATYIGGSLSAVINSNGTTTIATQVGEGLLFGASLTSGAGPNIIGSGGTLSTAQRSVSLGSGSTSAQQDNTRTN